MHNVAVLYDIFFAFHAHLSGFLNGCFGTICYIIVIFDHFGTDEAFLEIGMDHTGTLRRFPAFFKRPGTYFLYAGSQVSL